jgi:hypothetical protein
MILLELCSFRFHEDLVNCFVSFYATYMVKFLGTKENMYCICKHTCP